MTSRDLAAPATVAAALRSVAHDVLGCNGLHVELDEAIREAEAAADADSRLRAGLDERIAFFEQHLYVSSYRLVLDELTAIRALAQPAAPEEER